MGDTSTMNADDPVGINVDRTFICSAVGCCKTFECRRKLVRHQRRHNEEVKLIEVVRGHLSN
jgi:hypothetical protein